MAFGFSNCSSTVTVSFAAVFPEEFETTDLYDLFRQVASVEVSMAGALARVLFSCILCYSVLLTH